MALARLALVPLLVALASCSSAPQRAVPPAGHGPTDTSAREPGASLPLPSEDARAAEIAALRAEADRRVWSPASSAALLSPDRAVRRAAVRALARLHDPSRLPELSRALRDPDPSVRDAASMGLGGLGASAPDTAAAVLLGALVAEPDPSRRAPMLEDLGRIADEASLVPLSAAISGLDDSERAAACRALGHVSRRGRSLPPDLLARVVQRTVEDPVPAVRLGCAHVLARLPAGDLLDAASLEALFHARQDPDPEVRTMVYRALQRADHGAPDQLVEGTHDSDWRVGVQAVRLLARRAEAVRAIPIFARALSDLGTTLLTSGDAAPGGPLHVFLAAVEAARPMARHPTVQAASATLLARLAVVPEGHVFTRDRGLAHCAVAALLDQGQDATTNTEACGLRQVNAVERAVQVASLLGRIASPAARRASELTRRFEHPSPLVREAVVGAAATIEDAAARALVLAALANDPSRGVRITALEGLAAFSDRRASRRATAILAGSDTADDWPAAEIGAALGSALPVFLEADDLEGLVAWLGASSLGTADPDTRSIEALAAHANPTVRQAARDALEARGLEVPEGPARAVENAVPEAHFRAPIPARARLETSRGWVELELLSDEAPSTVIRFVELARRGFYDGLTWHRVVPAFVVQGGDPAGDGFGGPGWSQRCEDNRVSYTRGTVGMALAGRDTGGSQFFITLAAQLHLDGQYTAFARVTAGMEVIEQLQAGDLIRQITIEQNRE